MSERMSRDARFAAHHGGSYRGAASGTLSSSAGTAQMAAEAKAWARAQRENYTQRQHIGKKLASALGGTYKNGVLDWYAIEGQAYAGRNSDNYAGALIVTPMSIDLSGSPEVVYAGLTPKLFSNGVNILNAGSTLAGTGELGLTFARQFKNGQGPKMLARTLSKISGKNIGTQKLAAALRNFSGNAKNLGARLGGVGAALGTVDYLANFSSKNGYEHANYWLGLGVFAIATINPVTAGIAVVYGAGQFGSYLYNGKTLEENVGTSLGF